MLSTINPSILQEIRRPSRYSSLGVSAELHLDDMIFGAMGRERGSNRKQKAGFKLSYPSILFSGHYYKS
jgi:hypothetical protein